MPAAATQAHTSHEIRLSRAGPWRPNGSWQLCDRSNHPSCESASINLQDGSILLSVQCPDCCGNLGRLFRCLLLFRPPCTLCCGNPGAAFCAHGVLPGRPARLASRADRAVVAGKKVADCAKVGNLGVDRRDDVGCIHTISLRRLPLITKHRQMSKSEKEQQRITLSDSAPGFHRSYCSDKTLTYSPRHLGCSSRSVAGESRPSSPARPAT